MMINKPLAGAIAAIAAISPSCDDDQPQPEPRPVQVIWVGEDYHWQFDARPGDYIVQIMNPEGDMLDRCNHSGGELIYNPHTLIWMCEGLDF